LLGRRTRGLQLLITHQAERANLNALSAGSRGTRDSWARPALAVLVIKRKRARAANVDLPALSEQESMISIQSFCCDILSAIATPLGNAPGLAFGKVIAASKIIKLRLCRKTTPCNRHQNCPAMDCHMLQARMKVSSPLESLSARAVYIGSSTGDAFTIVTC
jgi:hypothetical protein